MAIAHWEDFGELSKYDRKSGVSATVPTLGILRTSRARDLFQSVEELNFQSWLQPEIK
jgi:hypothetical protein